LASEIGEIARFATPRKLIGYAGPAPRVHQSGERSHTGALSRAGSRTLRWAAVEAAHAAWQPTNPWHELPALPACKVDVAAKRTAGIHAGGCLHGRTSGSGWGFGVFAATRMGCRVHALGPTPGANPGLGT
jgi:Transposase IS116/IS110/IS902 family